MLDLSFKGKNFKIVEKFIISLIISLVVILAGVGVLIAKGMNLGIEFGGGAIVDVEVNNSVANFDEDSFKKDFKTWLEEKGYRVNSNVQEVGESGYEFRIGTTMKKDGKDVDLTEKNDEGQELLIEEVDSLKVSLKEEVENYFVEKYNVESDVSVKAQMVTNREMKNTIKQSLIAVAVAIVVILAYIAIRFTLLSGVAAILALCHDVLVMIAFTTIFQVPVNATFIAAVITIIGYSINATIVVFDRIRELEKTPSYAGKTDKELANEAITSTLARSILTTITTLVMIGCLAIFGTATIREFALPIIFGLVAGAFSSVLLSAPMWVVLRKLFKQENKRPKIKVKKQKEVNA